MMLGFLNFRVYLIIAVVVGGLCAAIVYFDPSGNFGGFFLEIGNDARPFLGTGLTRVIFEPLNLIFTNYYWAVAAGILWPLLLIWTLFFLIGLGATIVGPSMSELDSVG